MQAWLLPLVCPCSARDKSYGIRDLRCRAVECRGDGIRELLSVVGELPMKIASAFL